MKMAVNILLGVLVLLGIGLLTTGSSWGSLIIGISALLIVFTLFSRNQVKKPTPK
jgi:hypothetical protein